MNPAFMRKLNAALTGTLAMLYVGWWMATGAPGDALSMTALLVAIVPLVLLAPLLWQGRRFATALAGLILPFHFAFAVMELVANPEVRPWVALQTFIAFVLFATVMASLRQVRAG